MLVNKFIYFCFHFIYFCFIILLNLYHLSRKQEYFLINLLFTWTMQEIKSLIAELSLKIDKKFDGLESRINIVDNRLNTIDSRLNTIDTRLNNIEQRLGRIEKSVSHENADFTIRH